jgi:hypothetical protein
MPQTAMQFVRLVGLGATLRLADCAKPDRKQKERRGFRIRVPSGPISDDHALVQTIGREAADLVVAYFSGETLPFPVRRMRALRRDIDIARDHIQGIPVPVLACTHKVSERTVARALCRVTHGDIQRAGPTPPPPLLGSSGTPPLRV